MQHTGTMTAAARILFFTLLNALCFYGAFGDTCPCKEQELCQQIKNETKFEVFVFDVGGQAWRYYDWSKVTTIAAFGQYDPELMCFAHSKGARLVLKGDVSVSAMVDPTNRTTWIKEKVTLAKKQFMDGINIDIEQAVEDQSPEFFALTSLVKETTEAFHREIPGSQVSFDVAWSPKCIDKRCYDYKGIADACDLLFVMSYDEQSQIWGDCIAMANAPYDQTLTAYDQYIKMKIDPKKLVMGVPWYGYDYPCLSFSQAGVCSIQEVPFRGAPCSDAAGRQIPYSDMMKQVNSSMSGRIWDKKQQAPYYNYKAAGGQVHQVWYDDPQSISLKAAYVTKLGLRGIGMWNGNILDYSNNPVAQQQTQDMWDALMTARDTVSSGVAPESSSRPMPHDQQAT
ncbi:di-N-acetylchitobiase-like [Engraulis encrasicolus]|uniref:di-N-acetylchitobiase-like n=1 Tax=Engraulis encrasicolus TaxID=184585 RepID=UPI002FCF3ED8